MTTVRVFDAIRWLAASVRLDQPEIFAGEIRADQAVAKSCSAFLPAPSRAVRGYRSKRFAKKVEI